MNEMEFKITGPDEEINQFLEPMLNYFTSGKGNLFSYLKTLDDDILINLSDSFEKEDEKNIKLCFSMAILALGAQFGELEKSIDDLIKDAQGFAACCCLALQEKSGLIILEDKSKIWDPASKITITLTDRAIKLAKALGIETKGVPF